MTDIVERLERDLALGLSASIGDTKKAIDEIKRLRKALERIVDCEEELDPQSYAEIVLKGR
jgi:GTP cyclohydrolase III